MSGNASQPTIKKGVSAVVETPTETPDERVGMFPLCPLGYNLTGLEQVCELFQEIGQKWTVETYTRTNAGCLAS